MVKPSALAVMLSTNASVVVALLALDHEDNTQFVYVKTLLGLVEKVYVAPLAVFVLKSASNVVFFTNASTLNSTRLDVGFAKVIVDEPFTDNTAISLVTVVENLLSGIAVEFHAKGSAPESV